MNSTLRTILTTPPPIILPSIKPSLAAYYDSKKTDLSDQTKWSDFSGNGRDMALYNLAGVPGSRLSVNGFEVDGIDDYGSIADSPATRLTTGGTLMAWIYPKSLGETAGRIFDKSTDTAGANGYIFYFVSPNTLRFRTNTITIAITDSISEAVKLNQWQRAVVTFDSTGRCLYANGVDVTATGGTETALPPDVAGPVCIGNRAGATDRTFDGYIDKAAIITRALTPQEVQKDFQNTRRYYGV